MRNKIIIASILMAFGFLSCTESYIEGYEISPNDPSAVLEANLLTSTQVAIIGNVTGEISRTTSIWMQSQAGLKDQSASEIAVYKAKEGDNTNDFNSMYSDWMETAHNLIAQAGDENPHYKGMGLVLEAWAGAYISDIWGDIAFSQAIQGAEELHPSYDTQEEVYKLAQAKWSAAIKLFESSSNKTTPGGDDLFYGGDVSKWIKMAWTLKARYHNRASKHNSFSADSVLICAAKGFQSSEDNLLAQFGTNANNANQWYAMYLQRGGYMGMGKYFVDHLQANADPRLPFYANKDNQGNYVGSPADTRSIILTASPIGPMFIGNYSYAEGDVGPKTPNNPVIMASYSELQFLIAEAKLRKGDAEGAAAAYNEGVIASVEFVTGAEAPAAFVAAQASKTAGDMNLENIMNAKYDALFTQVEVWSDWRRTGFPVLEFNPDPKAEAQGIPLRLPTCIDERLYNKNAVVVNDNYAKLWFAQ